MPITIPKGRTLSMKPNTQPSDGSLTQSRASYKMGIRGGNRANENQQVRNGTRKFHDAPTDRTAVPTTGVSLTPALRSE